MGSVAILQVDSVRIKINGTNSVFTKYLQLKKKADGSTFLNISILKECSFPILSVSVTLTNIMAIPFPLSTSFYSLPWKKNKAFPLPFILCTISTSSISTLYYMKQFNFSGLHSFVFCSASYLISDLQRKPMVLIQKIDIFTLGKGILQALKIYKSFFYLIWLNVK